MDYKLLGQSGLRVSEMFLGTMTFGEDWGWGAAPEECRRMIDVYAEAGGNVIDTAVNYTNGSSEEIVGQAIEKVRDRFVVCTKYTLTLDPTDPNAAGNHRKNLKRSLERSLRRLRTDYVDVYWVHIWDPRTPIEETMRALDDAVLAGKILYVGLSDMPAWVVARANTLAQLKDWCPAVAIQVLYNLACRDAERDLLPMARALGLSVGAWSPLAGGLLSGKFTDPPAGSLPATRLEPASLKDQELSLARRLGEVAADLGATPSQTAIAWTMARWPNVHPVIGARRVDQLRDNLGAVEVLARLRGSDALEELDAASRIELGFPHDFIADTRQLVYGEAGLRVAERDATQSLRGPRL
ncbi:MAG TPA: aldo/keto reductase [Acidimicrobiales bacterium]|nr:aldo/keto reductase [Acidimicrobiales bacterium]